MDVDAETETRIVEKVEYIEEAVAVLSRKQSLERETYLSNREQRAIVEREFQTALEAGNADPTGQVGTPDRPVEVVHAAALAGPLTDGEDNMADFDFEDIWETVSADDEDAEEDDYPVLQALDRETQLEVRA